MSKFLTPNVHVIIKKTKKIMKNLKTLTAIFFLTISILSCSKSDPEPILPAVVSCDSSNTTFKQLYLQTDLSSSTISETLLADLKIFEYTFNVSSNKTICSIGLTALINNTPYTIEIFNKTTNTMAFTGLLIFNAGANNYNSIAPTILITGNTYVIRRKTTNLADTQTKGLINTSFPLTLNGLTITNADIYDTTVPSVAFNNKVLPFIDIVFQ